MCSIVRQSTSSSRGEQTRYARHCAREIATLKRFRERRKSSPRGTSSPLDGPSSRGRPEPPAPGTCPPCRPHLRRHERAEEVDLRVERRDDLDLRRRDAGRDETNDLGAHARLPPRATPAGSPWCGAEIQRSPVPSGVVRRSGRCVRLEPALVELLGDEAADVRVEAERPLEEDAAVGRDRRRRRRSGGGAPTPRSRRDASPGAPGRAAAGRRRAPPSGRRSPSRTHPPARPGRPRRRRGSRSASRGGRPRTARPSRQRRRGRRSPRCRRRSRPSAPRTPTPSSRGSPSSRPRNCSPRSDAALSTSARSLWIARWLVEATPTLLPSATSRAISLPAVQVFPEPGGPWITRCLGRGRPTGRAQRRHADREQQLGELVEVGRLHVAAEGVPAEDRLEHGVRPATVEQRAAEPLQRLLLRLRRVDVARDQRRRKRHLVEHGAALQLERARVGIVDDNLARSPAGRGVDR